MSDDVMPALEKIAQTDIADQESALTALAELNAMVESMKVAMTEMEEHNKTISDERKAIDAEYKQRVYALNERESQFKSALFDARRNLKKITSASESVQRRYQDLKLAEELAANYLTLEKRWDAMTAGAPWREWAKDHQIEGAKKITYAGRMIVGDTMGLGKTLTSIIALDMIKASTTDAREDNPVGGTPHERQIYNSEIGEYVTTTYYEGAATKPCGNKVLYFCPATMLKNVEREVRRWAPHRNVVILGGIPKAARRFALETMALNNQYVVILNYEAWRKDKQLISDLIDIEFDTMIIDEAHNIKDRASIAYRGIKQIIDGSDIPFVIPMTGTPILNRPQELFSLLTLINPRRFRTESQYLADFCEQDYNGKWRFREGGLTRLSELIRANFIRRTKEDAGIVLPPKTIVIHELDVDEELYPNQARAREEMRKWGSIILDPDQGKAVTAAAVIAMYTRLRQIETWPAGIEVKDQHGDLVLKVDIEESQKLDEVIRPNGPNHSYDDPEGILPEVVGDERVVVFSQFKAPLRELKRRCELAGINAVVLDGDTPGNIRDEIAMDFDNKYTTFGEHKWDVVLCHYRVGGVGMNLTSATQMIIVDEEWNPGKRDQAFDRIHRIGQDRPVTIHVLRDKGTVDNWLAGLIEDKEKIVDGFNSAASADSEEAWNALKNGLI
jgi:SNF2 family DNA or RNA helicase